MGPNFKIVFAEKKIFVDLVKSAQDSLKTKTLSLETQNALPKPSLNK